MVETENNNNQVEIVEDMENEEDKDNEEDVEGGDENDDEGWITPGNIKKVKQEMGYDDEINMKDADVKCACLTTDFAMQVLSLTFIRKSYCFSFSLHYKREVSKFLNHL